MICVIAVIVRIRAYMHDCMCSILEDFLQKKHKCSRYSNCMRAVIILHLDALQCPKREVTIFQKYIHLQETDHFVRGTESVWL